MSIRQAKASEAFQHGGKCALGEVSLCVFQCVPAGFVPVHPASLCRHLHCVWGPTLPYF